MLIRHSRELGDVRGDRLQRFDERGELFTPQDLSPTVADGGYLDDLAVLRGKTGGLQIVDDEARIGDCASRVTSSTNLGP